MSQFFVVQGPDPLEVNRYLARGITAFDRTMGSKPHERMVADFAGCAYFPRLAADSPSVSHCGRAWACVAGAFFYKRKADGAALDSFCGDQVTESGFGDFGLRDVDGTFALCAGLGDGRVIIITDRIGSLHVYQATAKNCVVISTSSLVLAAILRPEWDVVGCREFLATGTVFSAGKTLFKGIEKLGPASVYEFKGGRMRSRRSYWDSTEIGYDPERGSVPRLASALANAVGQIAANFKRPALDLTGGFDSRTLLATALNKGCEFETVVVGESNDRDVVIAKNIAVEFQLKHHHYQLDRANARTWWSAAKESIALCDGEYDALEYAGILEVHRRMAMEHDISINGSYGELCRGLFWEILMPFTGWRGHFNARRLAVKRYTSDGGEIAGLLQHPFSTTLENHFIQVIQDANAGLELRPNTVLVDNNTLKVYAQRWQGRIASSTNRLWPSVAPFLWREPMEAALSAPPRMRLRCRMGRRLIEYLNPHLAELETSHGYPALPLRLTTAHRFWPVVPLICRRLTNVAAKAITISRPRQGAINPLLALWKQDEISDVLNVGSMLTRDVYHRPVLEAFLRNSKTDAFADRRHFGRVLTMELLARAVHTQECGLVHGARRETARDASQ